MSARRLSVAAACAATSLVIAACGGGFDSSKSGDHLIRDYIRKFAQGKLTLDSVHCPSGVAQKAGHTYNCAVVLRDSKGGKHPGTITIEMLSGNRVLINGTRDVHVR